MGQTTQSRLPKFIKSILGTDVGQEDARSGIPAPKILLVDDDPLYAHVMRKAANKLGIHLVYCGSIGQAKEQAKDSYDAVILDYMLSEDERGTDAVEHLDGKPVFMVSNVGNWSSIRPDLPSQIKKFIPKNSGAKAILAEVVRSVRPEFALSQN